MKLEDVLNYKEKTIDDVLGYVKPTLEQVMGLEPMPVSRNMTPPEPEPKPVDTKPTIMDRIKGVKDKILGNKKDL